MVDIEYVLESKINWSWGMAQTCTNPDGFVLRWEMKRYFCRQEEHKSFGHLTGRYRKSPFWICKRWVSVSNMMMMIITITKFGGINGHKKPSDFVGYL